jgi:undecaprenyl-diphosphatase
VLSGGHSRSVTRPRTAWSFVAARFRPATRLGLMLTVQLALLTLLLSAFSVVTQDVVAGDELVAADGPIESFLIDRRTPGLTVLMRVFTAMGSAAVVIPVLLGVGLLARRVRGSWRPLLFLAVTVAGATLTSTLIKVVIARPRPESGALVRALGYAFPSGHSTTAAATWFSVAVVLGWMIARRAVRVLSGVVATVVVLLVGISRVYLGVHAPTDVLGGWALGALWVAGTLIAFRILDRRDAIPVP